MAGYTTYNDFVKVMNRRKESIEKYLSEYSDILAEQKQVIEGSSERIYWFHGYLFAIKTFLKELKEIKNKG